MAETTMVVKRNGEIEPFALGRIALAVFRAAQAQKPPLPAAEGRRLGAEASQIVSVALAQRARFGVEEVQDEVVLALRALGRFSLADSYQAYREERAGARGQLALSRKAEKAFRFEGGSSATEVGREAWANALQSALDQGAGKEWTVAQWWGSCKEDATRAKNFDDFVGAHIKALLENCEEREHWLGSARALLMERWRARVCGAAPLLWGSEEAQKAERAHFKMHWAWRRSDQKASWFPASKEIEGLSKAFDPALDAKLGFAGLSMMEQAFGFGPEALTPQEIFANCAIAMCWSQNFADAKREGDGRFEAAARLVGLFSQGRLLPPLTLMRQARNAYPSLAQETHFAVGDSMESIFEALAKTVAAIKAGVSASVDISALRAEAAPVGREGQTSGGIAPVLRLFGEACGMLRGRDGEKLKARLTLACWHRDLESFLAYCKIAPKEMRLAVSLPDAFMRRVFDGGDWPLASPSEAPQLALTKGPELERWAREYAQMAKFGGLGSARCAPAREIFDWICQCAAAADGPSIVFSDACVAFEDPKAHGRLSSRMSAIFVDGAADPVSMELGLNVDGCSREESLAAFVEAHRSMGRVSIQGRRCQASVAPVGMMEPAELAQMLEQASRLLDQGADQPKESLWRQPSPWAARAKTVEAARGGYVEREEEGWDSAAPCSRVRGPGRLVGLCAREEYLWLSGANPMFVNHRHHRRQVWFEGARAGFGGTGEHEPLKKQAARAASWQKWSDGALALDARLAQTGPAEIGEAIKVAWLRGLSGVRRFMGPKPEDRR
jgi:hypothetical protein